MLLNLTGVIVIMGFFSAVSFADSCPEPEQIRQRDISQYMEWTVDERTSLDDLLGVKTLYAVRIINFGEYVSCRYTTDKWPVTMDGKPVSQNCTITPDAGEWDSTDSGQFVCRELDVSHCGFRFKCYD